MSGESPCFANITVTEDQAEDTCYLTLVLMFLIQLGAGLGGIAVLSHGIAYVDDNVEKGSSAALIGKTRPRVTGIGIKSGGLALWGRLPGNSGETLMHKISGGSCLFCDNVDPVFGF
jgi:hypothetical protein